MVKPPDESSEGRRKSKKIVVSSVFDATEENVWELLQKTDTLRYIAAPYAYFTPLGSERAVWTQGMTADFRLLIFGIIPLGVHHIHVVEFDRHTGRIYTNESNAAVPVWNHLIRIESLGEHETRYSDEVEISAGWKTGLVSVWSRLFYKHRQKRWRRLLIESGRRR
jgi:ligand-binding SRPBCC domain-containing protein